MNKTIGLIILWEKARMFQDDILSDMKTQFELKRVYEVAWSLECLEANYTRFFEKPLNYNYILKQFGTGPFLVCIVESDLNNIQTAIQLYKKMVTKPNSIFGAYTDQQVNRDLTLLFGKNVDDILRENNEHSNTWLKVNKDLVGAKGWDNLSQVFYVLNNTVNYAVLRNVNTITNNYNPDTQGDIDILVEDLNSAKYIINGRKYLSEYMIPGMYKLSVAGKEVEFDMCYVGDDYMDIGWEREILRSVVVVSPPPPFVGVRIPNAMHQYFTLLYHAYVHKKELSIEYHEKLKRKAMVIGATYQDNAVYSMGQLQQFLNDNAYQFTIPSRMEGDVNWRNLRYVQAYSQLRMHYLLRYKSISVFRKILKGIKKRIKML